MGDGKRILCTNYVPRLQRYWMLSGAFRITLLPDVSTTDSLPLTSTSLSLHCFFVCSPVLTAALPRQLQRPEIDWTLYRCAWNIGTSSLGCWHKNSQETNADPCYLFIYNNGLTQPRSPPLSWLFREKSEWVIPSNFLLPFLLSCHLFFSGLYCESCCD